MNSAQTKLAYDTARCTGKEVPFGATYDDPECKQCARSQQTEHNPYGQWWQGSIKFDGTCPSKIKGNES